MNKLIKLLLRVALSMGFLSAVADRFGIWKKSVSVWGNWDNFLIYTKQITPWLPDNLISAAGIFVTIAELVLGLFLLIGFKIELTARISGFLLLIFALSMSFSTGIKSALDFSVFTAAGAAFALSTMREKFLEIK